MIGRTHPAIEKFTARTDPAIEFLRSTLPPSTDLIYIIGIDVDRYFTINIILPDLDETTTNLIDSA